MDMFLNSVFTSVFDLDPPAVQEIIKPLSRSTSRNTSFRAKNSKLDPTLEAFLDACKSGDLVTVGSLLSEGKVDPSAESNLPLKTAVSKRQYQIVSLLLLDKRVDPSMDNNNVFKLACEAGDVLLVRVLMTDSRVDPADDDNVAFKTACASGHNEVIKLLLTDDRIDPAAGSNHGIKFAAENGHDLLVQTLLKDPRVDPADDDNAAIKWAATAGHIKVVSLLLEDSRVEPQAGENYAFRNACENGHVAVVELLLSDKRINPADQSNYAIKRASRNGHLEVVSLLLKDPRVDPAAGGNNSINWAARNGHVEIVKLLIKDPRVDPSDGNIAVTWAAESEQAEVIKVLLTDARVIVGLETHTNPLLKRMAEIVGETTRRLLETIENGSQTSKEELQELTEHKQLLADATLQIQNITKEMITKDDTVAQFKSQIEKLKVELTERTNVIEALQDQNPEKAQDMLARLLQTEEKDAKLEALQTEYATLQAEHQEITAKYKEEQELSTQLKEQVSKLDSQLKEQVTKLQDHVKEIKNQGESVCVALKAQITELETVIATNQADIITLKRNLLSVEAQTDEKDQLISHLVEQASEKNGIIADKDQETLEYKQDIASLQESKLALANQFNTHITKTNDEIASFHATINELKASLETEKNAKAVLQKKLHDADKLVISYVAENGEKGRAIMELKDSLATLEYSWQDKFDEQEVSLTQYKTELEAMTKAKDDAIAQLQKLKDNPQGATSDAEV